MADPFEPPSCRHVVLGTPSVGNKVCGKPATHRVDGAGSVCPGPVCGIHARFWRDRHFSVTPLDNVKRTRKRYVESKA